MENVTYHIHNGIDAPKIKGKDIKDIDGGFTGLFFQTVAEIPTYTPTSFYDQVCIYVSGGTVLLYVYDVANATWQRFNYYEAP